MHCPSCQHENRPAAKFCEECGGTLRRSCASCGAELRPTAKFCDECGAATAGVARAAGAHESPARERAASPAGARKVVTVVFADLAGSTALQERVDAESAHGLMERYYATLCGAVEEHGGTVVKLLGDGVMAAFGVPQVSEDDAIRAVRAGVAMQTAFCALLTEQSSVFGDVGLRVAINTGEVVVSNDNDDVVGDPVNVAARLQQEAGNGDVVVGESTRRLVSSVVTLAPLGTVALKGRSEPVAAYRLISLERPAGVAATPFVGRDDELARLSAVYEAALRGPGTKLAVLVGSPGLGKSRLIDEFTHRLGDDASVIDAHCNAAGGATFAPIADALREFLGIAESGDTATLRGAIEKILPGGENERSRIAGGIVALLGGAPATPEETFFVIRRFLAAIAAKKPVVLVIDDLQWAEPLLLDLIDHLVQWGTGVPLVVLAGARPELRDLRSALVTTGGLVADAITLAGLDAGAATKLAAQLIGATDLPATVAAKVLATSEGNPLFVGELVRMLVDEGILSRENDRWIVGEGITAFEMPPTIHALLAARIEKLRAEDRAILECAAVVGRSFSRNAVAELLPRAVPDLDARLEALGRAELIERDGGWFLGEPVLRFHHSLIRDAAYRRLLKGTRAGLHARFADWVEARIGDGIEHDETIGWHLERACGLLGELGPGDDKIRDLAERASRRLTAAGRRALARDDVAMAADLLGRGIALVDAAHPARTGLVLDWCEALLAAGEIASAATAVDELGRLADGNARLRAWHTCFAGQLGALTAPESLQATADAVEVAAADLAKLGDDTGEAKAHFVHAQALARLGKVGACEAALDRALAAARKAGDRRRANAVLAGAPLAALWGPSPVTRASGRCLDVVRVLRITQGAPAVEAVALSCQGVLEALRGRTDAARRMIASARKMAEELGVIHRLHETDVFAARIDLLEGKNADAARTLRTAYEGLRRLGLGTDAAQAAALLASALLTKGRVDEADALSREAEALAGDDLKAAIAWRGVRAEVLAERGETEAAVELARAAVAIASATDGLLDHADARLALASALRAAGRAAEADAEEQHAHELWEEKGATLLSERSAGDGDRLAAAGAEHQNGEPGHARATTGESTAPAIESRRRIRPNKASLWVVRNLRAFRAHDLDQVAALVSECTEVIEHHNGTSYGRDGHLESIRCMMRVADSRFDIEILATLGESLVVGRRRVAAGGTTGGSFEVAQCEMDHPMLCEVDANGLLCRLEVFAPDRLGDALARLYARYAELLPEGAARDRAAAIGRHLQAWSGAIELQSVAATVSDDTECIDHRHFTTWSWRGKEDFFAQWGEQIELTERLTVCDEDVSDVAPGLLLVRQRYHGIVRSTGEGTFENVCLVLFHFDASGFLKSAEVWEPEDEAAAFTRFDELAKSMAAQPAETSSRRRVRPNAATQSIERFQAALGKRDREELGEMFDESLTVVHHPSGATYGRPEMIKTWRSAIRAESLDFRSEILATLGDALALEHHVVVVEGLTEAHLSEFGRTELDEIALIETDTRGRWIHCEIFAAEKLGKAVIRLYERYAETLPAGLERGPANTTARALDALTRFWEGDGADYLYSPDVKFEDHRLIGTWSARGLDELLEHFCSLREVAEELVQHDEAVLGLTSDTVLVRRLQAGKSRFGGGAYERHFLILSHFGRDGRLVNGEVFDVGQEAAALARFDELSAGEPTRATKSEAARSTRVPAIPENISTWLAENHNATTALQRWGSAFARGFETGDWEATRAICAHEMRFEDRQRRSLVSGDCELMIASARERVISDARPDVELVGTAGDRIVIAYLLWSGGPPNGRFELDYYALIEVDDVGLITGIALMDADDPDAVWREAWARWEATDPAAKLWIDFSAHVSDPNRFWDVFRSRCAPTLVVEDHRWTGMGRIVGRDSYLDTLKVLWEIAPDTQVTIGRLWLGHDSHAAVASVRRTGNVPDGGEYESDYLSLMISENGLITRLEYFETDAFEQALARFEELGATDTSVAAGTDVARRSRNEAARASPEIPPNTALRTIEKLISLGRSGEWQVAPTLHTDDFAYEDRSRRSLVRGGVEEWLAGLRYLMSEIRAEGWHEILGTLGDRIAVVHRAWRNAPGDPEFELDKIPVVEVDAGGKLRSVTLFDADDRAAAFAEAQARFEELRSDPLRIPPNAAMRALEQWDAAALAGDANAATALYDPSLMVEDRRRLIRLSYDTEVEITNTRLLIESGWRSTRTVLATAGDRLVLYRCLWTLGEEDARSEIDVLEIDEVNEEGLFVWTAVFDPEDRPAAHDVLEERWAASRDGNMRRALVEFRRAGNAHDLERLRTTLSDDFVLEDHRRTGMGRLNGADAYIASVAALHELSRDYRVDLVYVAASAKHGLVSVVRGTGTNTEGGDIELIIVGMFLCDDDKIARFEFFEPEQLDVALARLEEFRPASA